MTETPTGLAAWRRANPWKFRLLMFVVTPFACCTGLVMLAPKEGTPEYAAMLERRAQEQAQQQKAKAQKEAEDAARPLSPDISVRNGYAESLFTLRYKVTPPPDAKGVKPFSGTIFERKRIGAHAKERVKDAFQAPRGSKVALWLTGTSLGEAHEFSAVQVVLDRDDEFLLTYDWDVATAEFTVNYRWD